MDSVALAGDTFMRAPRLQSSELTEEMIAVLGVPHDLTKISRPGAAAGPQAIREATLMFQFAVTQMAAGEVVDIDAGTANRYRAELPLADVGDVALSDDAQRNFDAIADAVAEIAGRRARPLILGGDHFITYPSVTGMARYHDGDLAYLHVDMHLDLADDVPGFGKLASGTPLRRLLDDGTLRGERVVIFGAESFQHRNEWEYAHEHRVSVISSSAIARSGVVALLEPALDRALDGADGLYVSTDIDALARVYAPGTGNAVGTTGMTPSELIEVAQAIRERPLVGLDLVEVAPSLDPSGRTAGLAASYLIEILWPRLFEQVPA